MYYQSTETNYKMKEVFRSQRSIDLEATQKADADSEVNRTTRLKAVDYILDRYLAEEIDVDAMTDVLVISGLIENE